MISLPYPRLIIFFLFVGGLSVFEDEIEPDPSVLEKIIMESSKYFIVLEKSQRPMASLIQSENLKFFNN